MKNVKELFVFVICCISLQAMGQTEDHERLTTLNEQAKEYYANDKADSAIFLHEEILHQLDSLQLNDSLGLEIRKKVLLGRLRILRKTKQFDLGIDFTKECLSQEYLKKDYKYIGSVYYERSKISRYQIKHEEAILYLDTSYHFYELGDNWSAMGGVYNEQANLYEELGNKEKRKMARNRALRCHENNIEIDTLRILSVYLNLYADYLRENKFDSVAYFGNILEKYLEEAKNVTPSIRYVFRANNAVFLDWTGRQRESLNQRMKILKLADSLSYYSSYKPKCLHNISTSYLGLGDPYSAIKYGQLALEANRQILVDDLENKDLIKQRLAANHSAISSSYKAIGDVKSAKKHVQKHYEYAKEIKDYNRNGLAIAAYNLALFYTSFESNLDSAICYSNEALSLFQFEENSMLKSLRTAQCYSLLSMSYADNKKVDETEKTLEKLASKMEEIIPTENEKFLYESSKWQLLSAMGWCNYKIYETNSKDKYFEKAKHYTKQSIELLNNIYVDLDPSNAGSYASGKYETQKILLEIFTGNITGDIDKNKVLALIENQTSLLLKESQALRLSLSLLEEEALLSYQELQRKIAELENSVTSHETKSAEISALRNERDNLLVKTGIKLNKKTEPIEELIAKYQSLVHQEELTIIFEETESKIVVCLLAQDKQEIRIIKDKTEVLDLVRDLVETLVCGKGFDANLSHEVYQNLFLPLASDIKDYTSLKIITCQSLSNIPFELLITDESNNQMLLDKYQISYSFSFSDYVASLENGRDNSNSEIIAFAPKFEQAEFDDMEFFASLDSYSKSECDLRASGPIKGNIEETEKLEKKFNGRYFINSKASKANFLSIPDFTNTILLFATHAYSNQSNWNLSGIVLKNENNEEEILHSYEIQNMHINADLVVLSACETGIGQNRNGEGLMSLGRSFKYAGCSNILMSLWKVDDSSTAELMQSFFDHLGDGKGKARALAEAKKEFRKKHPELSPYHWAGFVLMGDDSPVPLQKKLSAFWFILLLPLGVVILMAVRRKRSMTS